MYGVMCAHVHMWEAPEWRSITAQEGVDSDAV
jgi:hypothetical protein